jgi:hypothetical protein
VKLPGKVLLAERFICVVDFFFACCLPGADAFETFASSFSV